MALNIVKKKESDYQSTNDYIVKCLNATSSCDNVHAAAVAVAADVNANCNAITNIFSIFSLKREK